MYKLVNALAVLAVLSMPSLAYAETRAPFGQTYRPAIDVQVMTFDENKTPVPTTVEKDVTYKHASFETKEACEAFVKTVMTAKPDDQLTPEQTKFRDDLVSLIGQMAQMQAWPDNPHCALVSADGHPV